MANDSSTASSAEKFSELFWAARKEHVRLKTAATPESPAHRAAVKFAEAQSWPWAKELLEASWLNLASNPSAAIKILSAVRPSLPERFCGIVEFLLGAAHYAKGEHDQAIDACRKALDDPNFETPGNAWNNLGLALQAKGEHDEAIKAHHRAIEDPKYETPAMAWNNLGIALEAKGELDEAIKAYRKALEDSTYETPGYAWTNLGNALSDKKDYDGAIKALRKAIEDPTYETHAYAWNSLGTIFADAGKIGDAIDAFEAALKTTDPTGQQHQYARFRLALLKAEIEPKALSPDDRALVEKGPSASQSAQIEESTGKAAAASLSVQIEDAIIAEIREAGDTQYDKYLAGKDSGRDDTLSILRGWSSAVTLLEGSERLWRGGGYFLKWKGRGIVIDPGFDFLRNFHDAGYHGREIGAVLVSHNHPDHNSELKDVDDLRYEMWKRLKVSGGPGSQPYVLVWDEDTQGATKFGFEAPEHQLMPIVMSSGFPQPFDLSTHAAKIPIRVIPFKANHGSDVKHAMGMVVELLDDNGESILRIGYTADTEYFSDLQKHLANCDVLIAHISQPSIEELQEATKLKSIHLGYRGTAKLLGECKPKLALIGEYWAGLTDLRIPLVKGLRQRSGIDNVLPAGLGMHLSLPSLDIECTECHERTPFAKMKVAPPADRFGNLAYLCDKCMLG